MDHENHGAPLAGLGWVTAAAMFVACLDVLQVRHAIGGRPLLSLTAMVLSVYGLLAVASGLVFALLGRMLARRGGADGRFVFSAGWSAWLALFVLGYVNIVHLPSIKHPVTVAINLALALLAVGSWRYLRGAPWTAALARSARAAAVCTVMFVVVALLLARGASSGDERTAPLEPAASDSQDVIAIVIDTLRYDRTGAGGRADLMPTLDRLAEEGLLFRRAYAQSSWTKPSVASLFTSLHPSTHQANLRRDRLSDELVTLPEVFADGGYRTAVFSANPWISPAFGFNRGVQHFYESEPETFARLVVLLRVLKAADRLVEGRPIAALLGRLEPVFSLDQARRSNCERDVALVDELERWLAAHPGEPLFAYLHLMSPHIPYDPPGNRGEFSNADQVALLHSTERLPPERAELLEELYDATVAHADDVLERIVALLRTHGRSERAVIVVTADHGEEFYEHGRWGHGKSLYDEVVHVPLIVHAPGRIEAGAIDAPVMLVDVLPTLAELAAHPAPSSWAGTDLREAGGDRSAYAELLREGGFDAYMVYHDGYKYLETTAGLGQPTVAEVYRLADDPAERDDLSSKEVAKDLSRLLAGLRDRAREGRVAGASVAIDEAAAERLKALGYAN